MKKEELLEMLRKYLIWRFITNNVHRYEHYCQEWIENLHIEQLMYFKEEMIRLTKRGIYRP